MILRVLREYDLLTAIPVILTSILTVLFSLSLHECAHALMAYALGDPTAKNRGRLTLNPIKHLHPVGTIMMLLFGFGWANPVPVNAYYFKKKKLGMALTSLAGPVSNLMLSFVALTLYFLLQIFGPQFVTTAYTLKVFEILGLFLVMMHTMNLYLAIFNLIPVPPLDGSRILFIFLPAEKYFQVMKYERYIALILVVLLYVGVLDGPLSFITTGITNAMLFILNSIVNLFI